MTNNLYIGSSFDDFLAEEGILEDCTQFAINKVALPPTVWKVYNSNTTVGGGVCG
jgi:hypothetical protein